MNQNIKPMPPKVTIDMTGEVSCGKCKNNVFSSGIIFRKVSRLVSGESTDKLLPIEVFYCIACGNIFEDVLPEPLKELFKKDAAAAAATENNSSKLIV